MTPVEFPENNCTYAKDQLEYLPLPVHKDQDGLVTSCWRLTFWERVKLLFTGRMYFQVMTFNGPLQPQRPAVDNPIGKEFK